MLDLLSVSAWPGTAPSRRALEVAAGSRARGALAIPAATRTAVRRMAARGTAVRQHPACRLCPRYRDPAEQSQTAKPVPSRTAGLRAVRAGPAGGLRQGRLRISSPSGTRRRTGRRRAQRGAGAGTHLVQRRHGPSPPRTSPPTGPSNDCRRSTAPFWLARGPLISEVPITTLPIAPNRWPRLCAMPTSRVARSQHGLAYPNQQWMAAQTMTSSQLCCSNYFQYHFWPVVLIALHSRRAIMNSIFGHTENNINCAPSSWLNLNFLRLL